MHLLRLVQRQLQAAQKQASLSGGKGNLYQSVNIPIKKPDIVSKSVYFFLFQTHILTISPSNKFHYCKNINQTHSTKSLERL